MYTKNLQKYVILQIQRFQINDLQIELRTATALDAAGVAEFIVQVEFAENVFRAEAFVFQQNIFRIVYMQRKCVRRERKSKPSHLHVAFLQRPQSVKSAAPKFLGRKMLNPRRLRRLEEAFRQTPAVAFNLFYIAADFACRDAAHDALRRMRQVEMHIGKFREKRLLVFAISDVRIRTSDAKIRARLFQQKPNTQRLHLSLQELEAHRLFAAVLRHKRKRTFKRRSIIQRRNISDINLNFDRHHRIKNFPLKKDFRENHGSPIFRLSRVTQRRETYAQFSALSSRLTRSFKTSFTGLLLKRAS